MTMYTVWPLTPMGQRSWAAPPVTSMEPIKVGQAGFLRGSATLAANDDVDERLLYQTMTKICDVKLARGAVQRLFQPLREQVAMLKRHHSNISEVDRAAFNEEKILPLQNQEMQKIRVKIEGFREDVRSFRAEFLDRCPLEVRMQ
ncbi:unnamed protein product [Cladocopium goreaui]|uniref:Dynein heavy chain tail domain-containing protein n=1 Tax=Cladocopium goreaui TaxID=2562237 RepID=A0A9P1CP96_9DINO|nr:unnamed protein product [Cladocopium goreaui]